MRRRRRSWNLIGRLCGALALAFLTSWVTGRWWAWSVFGVSENGRWAFWFTEKALHISRSPQPLYALIPESEVIWMMDGEDVGVVTADADDYAMYSQDPRNLVRWWSGPGKEWRTLPAIGRQADGSVDVTWPHWCSAALLGTVSVVAEYRHRRRHRRERDGICTKCGYDRMGIALDAPCPECGKRVEAKKTI